MQQSVHEDCLQPNPDNINNKEKEKPEVFPPESSSFVTQPEKDSQLLGFYASEV